MGESSASPTQTKEVTSMTNQAVPICGAHQAPKEWKATTFVYDDDGVSIEVPNVYAWVCPIDGQASITSDTTDELIETVRDLVTPAKRARERRSIPTEYIVRVA